MSTQETLTSWDDEVDLRRYVVTLVRHKWLILAIVVVAVAVTGVANYAVLSSVYESSGVVSLPAEDTKGGLGMTPQRYAEFASSKPVLDGVRQRVGAELSGIDLRSSYDFSLDPVARSLTVTASAPSKEQALLLARAWIDAFDEGVEAEVFRQFAQMKESATQKEANLQPKLAQAEARLGRNERESPVGVMDARLRALEQELVAGEVRLRQLNSSTIPLDETKLEFLQKILEVTPKNLQASPGTSDPSSNTITTNPVYLQLSQEWASTAVRLAVSRREVEILARNTPGLEVEAQQLRARIRATLEEQEPLVQDLKRLGEAYAAASTELKRLQELEPHLSELSRLATIQEPVQPSAPLSPQRVRNVVMAGALGAFLGMLVVLSREWYRAQPLASAAHLEGTVRETSPEEPERQRRQPVG